MPRRFEAATEYAKKSDSTRRKRFDAARAGGNEALAKKYQGALDVKEIVAQGTPAKPKKFEPNVDYRSSLPGSALSRLRSQGPQSIAADVQSQVQSQMQEEQKVNQTIWGSYSSGVNEVLAASNRGIGNTTAMFGSAFKFLGEVGKQSPASNLKPKSGGGLWNLYIKAGEWMEKAGSGMNEQLMTERAAAVDEQFANDPLGALKNPDFYLTELPEQLVPTLALMAPGVGVTGAVANTGRLATASPLLRYGVAAMAGSAVMRPIEAMMEAGDAYNSAIEMGMSEQEALAAGGEVFRGNMKLVGLDAVQLAMAATPLGNAIFGKSGIPGKIIKETIESAVAGATEGGEEVYQLYVQNTALGQDFDIFSNESKQSFILGLFGGLIFQAAGRVMSKEEKNEATDQITDNIIDRLPQSLRDEINRSVQESISQNEENSVEAGREAKVQELDRAAQENPEAIASAMEQINREHQEAVRKSRQDADQGSDEYNEQYDKFETSDDINSDIEKAMARVTGKKEPKPESNLEGIENVPQELQEEAQTLWEDKYGAEYQELQENIVELQNKARTARSSEKQNLQEQIEKSAQRQEAIEEEFVAEARPYVESKQREQAKNIVDEVNQEVSSKRLDSEVYKRFMDYYDGPKLRPYFTNKDNNLDRLRTVFEGQMENARGSSLPESATDQDVADYNTLSNEKKDDLFKEVLRRFGRQDAIDALENKSQDSNNEQPTTNNRDSGRDPERGGTPESEGTSGKGSTVPRESGEEPGGDVARGERDQRGDESGERSSAPVEKPRKTKNDVALEANVVSYEEPTGENEVPVKAEMAKAYQRYFTNVLSALGPDWVVGGNYATAGGKVSAKKMYNPAGVGVEGDASVTFFPREGGTGVYLSGSGNFVDENQIDLSNNMGLPGLMYRTRHKDKDGNNNFIDPTTTTASELADILKKLVETDKAATERGTTEAAAVPEDGNYTNTDSKPIDAKQGSALGKAVVTLFDNNGSSLNDESVYFEVKREGYMPLHVERLPGNRLAVSHVYEQNGDLIRDPEVVFDITKTKKGAGQLVPDTIEHPPMVFNGRELSGPVKISQTDSFLKQWADNLKSQGFLKAQTETTEAPADTVTRAEIEALEADMRSQYLAAGTTDQDGYTTAEQVLNEILVSLEIAEAGYQFPVGATGQWDGVPSTFPDWIPDNARNRSDLDYALVTFDDVRQFSYPKKRNETKRRLLADALFEQLDMQLSIKLGTDFSTEDLRKKIINAYEYKTIIEPEKGKTTIQGDAPRSEEAAQSPSGKENTENLDQFETEIEYHGTSDVAAEKIIKEGFKADIETEGRGVSTTQDYDEALEYAQSLVEGTEDVPVVLKVRVRKGAEMVGEPGVDFLTGTGSFAPEDLLLEGVVGGEPNAQEESVVEKITSGESVKATDFARAMGMEVHEVKLSEEPTQSDQEDAQAVIDEEVVPAGGRENEGAEGRGLLDQYWTPNEAVQMTYSILASFGVNLENAQVLEPSLGMGNFLFGLPSSANVVGMEIDTKIAKAMRVKRPDITVLNLPFERYFIQENGTPSKYSPRYDLVIGNPPYGKHRGRYKGLGEEPKIPKYENYFIKRSLDVTKNKGHVAMVVPSAFLRNSQTEGGKKEIAKLGRLIGAVRLPNGAFEKTEIGTDILIFEKDPIEDMKSQSGMTIFDRRLKEMSDDYYFDNNQDHVLGEPTTRSGRFGPEPAVDGSLAAAQELFETTKLAGTPREKMIQESFVDIDTKTKQVDPSELPTEITELQKLSEENLQKEIQERTDSAPVEEHHRRVGENAVQQRKEATEAKRPRAQWEASPDGMIDLRTYTDKEAYEEGQWKYVQPTGELAGDFDPDKAYYMDGKYYNEFNYVQGNIYQRLEQLEADKDALTEEKYQEQKTKLEAVIPERMTVERMRISPHARFTQQIETQPGISLQQAFLTWVSNLPRGAFGESSPRDVRQYTYGQPVRGGDKLENEETRRTRRIVGDELFHKFLKDEINSEVRQKVEDQFNKQYNGYHKPDYRQVPLQSAVANKYKGNDFELREIQRYGIGFLVNRGVGLLAHDVGLGKTIQGVVANLEMLDRGWAKRPLVVAPNTNVYRQWLKDFKTLSPDTPVNELSNLGGDFKGDLASLEIADGSISIITEEGFKRLRFKDETYERAQALFEDAINQPDAKKTKREQALEKEKSAETIGKMQRKTNTERYFEDLGFDALTVDEIHNANHIIGKAKPKEGADETAQSADFRGFSITPSEYGLKTWLSAQYIQEQNDGRNVIGLSATPFTNHPLEYYSILSLFARKTMQDMGIFNVNDFMAMFMDVTSELEFKANNDYVERTEVRNFKNFHQFQQLLQQFIDFRDGSEAGIVRPERNTREYRVPENQMQYDLKLATQPLFNDTKNGGHFKAINALRLNSISPYASPLYEGPVPEAKEFVENSPKIKLTLELIQQTLKDVESGGQIVYSTTGVEKFPSFDLMKLYMVEEMGFKKEEIAIIKGGVSKNQRFKIQEDFNAGKIKVLFGSDAIQEGINLQEQTTDLYILSQPWNFTAVRQVIGRAWRQGNKWRNVRVNQMFTENSIDIFMAQKLQNKERRYEESLKRADDVVDVGDIDYNELKHQLLTDPVQRVKMEYQMREQELGLQISRLESDFAYQNRKNNQFVKAYDDVQRVKQKMAEHPDWEFLEGQLKNAEQRLTDMKTDLADRGVDMTALQKEMDENQAKIEKLTAEKESLKENQERAIKNAEVEKQNQLSTVGTLDVKKYTSDRREDNEDLYLHDDAMFKRSRSPEQIAEDKLFTEAMEHDTFESFLEAQGDPYYHGTRSDFTKFDPAQKGENTTGDNTEWGFFFLAEGDRERISEFMEDTALPGEDRPVIVKEAYLDINNPLDLTQKGIFSNAEQAPLLYKILMGETAPNLSPKKALQEIEEMIGLGEIGEFYDTLYSDPEHLEMIKSAGYDGVMSDFGDNITEYVAFEPEQIKTREELEAIYQMVHAPNFKTVWHGSGAAFDEPDLEFVGSGEGAAAYGWGFYMAESERVGKQYYEDRMAEKDDGMQLESSVLRNVTVDGEPIGNLEGMRELAWQPEAYLYQLELSDNAIDTMLLWDEDFRQQPDVVQNAVRSILAEKSQMELDRLEAYVRTETNHKGMWVYKAVENAMGGKEAASRELLRHGVRGVKYADGMTRYQADRTYNYVAFDTNDVMVLTRNGERLMVEDTPLANRVKTVPVRDSRTGQFLGSRRLYEPSYSEVMEMIDAAVTDDSKGRPVRQDGYVSELGAASFREFKAYNPTDGKNVYRYTMRAADTNEVWQRLQDYKERFNLDFDVQFMRTLFTGEKKVVDGRIQFAKAYGVTYNRGMYFPLYSTRTTPDHEMVHLALRELVGNKKKPNPFTNFSRREIFTEAAKQMGVRMPKKPSENAPEATQEAYKREIVEIEEYIAERFEAYVARREMRQETALGRFFQSIYDNMVKLYNAFGYDLDAISRFYFTLKTGKNNRRQSVNLTGNIARREKVRFETPEGVKYAYFGELISDKFRQDAEGFAVMANTIIDQATNQPAVIDSTKKDINLFENLLAQSRDLYLKDEVDFQAADLYERVAEAQDASKEKLDRMIAADIEPYMKLKKEDRARVEEILWRGDSLGQEYTERTLIEMGLTEQQQKAYLGVREALNFSHELLLVEMQNKGVEESEIDAFREERVGYMPHKWKHPYVVKHRGPDANGQLRTYMMESFKTKRQATDRANQLAQEATDSTVSFEVDKLSSLEVDFFSSQELTSERMIPVIDQMRDKGYVKDDVTKILKRNLVDMFKEKGFGRHYLRRTGVGGFDTNRTPEVLANYFTGFSGYVSKMRHSSEYFNALSKVDARRQPQFYAWLRDTIAYKLNNKPEDIRIPIPYAVKDGETQTMSISMRGMTFAYFLANDLSYLITNATQNFVVGMGEMSKYYSGSEKISGPERDLLKAMFDYSAGRITPGEQLIIDELLAKGQLGAEMAADLTGFKNNPVYNEISSRFHKVLFKSTAIIEQNVNRIPAFLAMYRKLLKDGYNNAQAADKALEVSNDIHFRYGRQHRPRAFRGRLAVVFVFQHYIRSFLFQLYRDASRREFAALTRKLGYTTALGGTLALPFASMMMGIIRDLLGDDREEEEIMREVGLLELTITRGLPASLLGVDLSGRVGIGLLTVDSIWENPADVRSYIGATGSLLFKRLPQGIAMMGEQRYADAAGKLLPDVAANPIKGITGYFWGVRTSSGNPLLDENGDPYKYNTMEALIRATGFTPTHESLLWDQRVQTWKAEDNRSSNRTNIRRTIQGMIQRKEIEEARQLQEQAIEDGVISENSDYVREFAEDDFFSAALSDWQQSDKGRSKLQDIEDDLILKLYNGRVTDLQRNNIRKEFAVYRQYGQNNEYIDDIMSIRSNAEKVQYLIELEQEIGEDAFTDFYKKGRSRIRTEAGSMVPILFSDPLDKELRKAKLKL